MSKDTFHLSDQDLLLTLDGELPARDSAMATQHLTACWTCRARKQELEATITEFVRCHHRAFEEQVGPGDGRRALLRARLDQLVATRPRAWRDWLTPLRTSWRLLVSTLLAMVAATFVIPSWSDPEVVRAVTMPDPRLTPGATVVMEPSQVCASENVKNREVSSSLQRKVFDKYGIKNASPQAYEIDYLITPALGGAEDEHNLWPHSYESTEWNAFVKDQLEDYLRDRVCSGQMDLATAQHEIAGDWIAAYKTHFRTDRPLREIPR